MPHFLQQSKINLGLDPAHYGHVVHSKAIYTDDEGVSKRVVFKENKNGEPELSRFEAAFGELARLFLPLDLTPNQNIVKNMQNGVVGVASEFMSYVIARREGEGRVFFNLGLQDKGLQLRRVQASAEEIPFYFLQQFPAGAVNTLLQMAKAGYITIDMASLVNVLGTSYSLEEDDLHKGNLGIYVVEKDGKPQLVFFKIDHDLMLADSVMSRCQSRFLNWFHGTDAFKITQRDLLNFPCIIDSQNYYWPTVRRVFGLNDRVAYNAEERMAFASLAESEEFRQCKWKVFYRHILIPPALISDSLTRHLDDKDPAERAKISLITQSVVARQAKLRAVLFSLPEFRTFVKEMQQDEKSDLVNGIAQMATDLDYDWIGQNVAVEMAKYEWLCENAFQEGDTPLHAAIRLQDYRYHETWDAFKGFASQKNDLGQTPLDLAATLFMEENTDTADVRADTLSTMKHMIQQGATPSKIYKATNVDSLVYDHDHIESSHYAHNIDKIKTFAELKALIREIGEDHRYSLKMQKEIALSCLRKFTATHKNDDRLTSILQQFKDSLNGTYQNPPVPEFQFIRQLRSELWIVRIIRGLFGGTATQVAMNKTIDQAILAANPNKNAGLFSFFYSSLPNKPEKIIDERHQPPEPPMIY